MKPKIFIGSSVEGLNIAYAIQDNLQHDAYITVWDQGIFKLSSNTLDDLTKALTEFNFGIFVFKPDDITQIRQSNYNTVRDNVIFELGLFIGKLGKERVFFVLPNSVNDFHLPTDLLGITPGKYLDRPDENLKAALGPFCNQVRIQIKDFIYENLNDLAGESIQAKKLAIEKPLFWEPLLAADLLRTRMDKINKSYEELEKGLVFQKTKIYSALEYTGWIQEACIDLANFIAVFKKALEIELVSAFTPPGSSINIKFVIDKIYAFCKELLSWECSLLGIKGPDELQEVTELMKRCTKIMIDEINRFPEMLEVAVRPENIKNNKVIIDLTFNEPPNLSKAIKIIKNYSDKF